MNKMQFKNTLISLFPSFNQYWAEEDINKEGDGSYTAHGLLSAFFFFYKDQHLDIAVGKISLRMRLVRYKPYCLL